MKLPLLALGIGFLALAIGIGAVFFPGLRFEKEEIAEAPQEIVTTTAEDAMMATSTDQEMVQATKLGCVLGVPGPANAPLTGTITAEMKEAAVDALIAREALFIENDPECLRAYDLALVVNPDDRAKIETQTEKQIRATALMMALIMDLPDAEEVRRLMLKEDTVWEYKEGEVQVSVTIENPPEEIVGYSDDGEPLYGTDNGWGTTIYYRNGRWY